MQSCSYSILVKPFEEPSTMATELPNTTALSQMHTALESIGKAEALSAESIVTKYRTLFNQPL